MSWLQFSFKTTEKHAEEIGIQLQKLGAESVTFEDTQDTPILEPLPGEVYYWQNTTISALFSIKTDRYEIEKWLKLKENAGIISDIQCRTLQDQDWERVCLQDIKPIQVGSRLWICPSWETPPDSSAVNLMLDPGLAFGTGTHPTTALCLEWLEGHISGGETIIDYGCGSGILGLAALKLGAKRIIAVDLDPQALSATLDNAKRNNIPTTALEIYLPHQLPSPPPTTSILVANILLQPLLTLAPLFATMVQPKGHLLLSGILITQIEHIRGAYSPWFDFSENPRTKNEWACLTATRRPTHDK